MGALAGAYQAPEGYVVHAAMEQPVSIADGVVADFSVVKSALDVYAERLVDFEQRKRQLVEDIELSHRMWEEAAVDDYQVPPAGSVMVHGSGVRVDSKGVEAGFYEEEVYARMRQLYEDVFRAQNECASKISGLYGGKPWVLNG